MSRRIPFVLALGLAIAACTPPAGGPGANGTGAVLSYDQKVKKVEQMTKALSITNNPELKKAADGVTTVTTSMSQGGFASTASAAGGLVAAGGGNMVAAGGGNLVAAGGGNLVAAGGGNYVLAALVEDLNRAARQDAYHLAGTTSEGGATISWDDATGELTSVDDGKTVATFKFTNGGKKRSWTIDLQKSPDGTTGTMTFEITADTWTKAPEAPPPQQTDDGSDPFAPNGFDPMAGDLNAPKPGGFEPDAGNPFAYRELQAVSGGAPFTVFGGEVPDGNSLSAARFACDLVPQGDSKLHVKVDVGVDSVKTTKFGRVPTHLALAMSVPSVAFTSDTTLSDTKIASDGGLKVKTEEALESFKYGLSMLINEGSGKFDLTHEGAKVRIGVVAAKNPKNALQPDVTAALYDVDGGQKIADLVPAEGENGVTLIKFTNGKTVKWDFAAGTAVPLPSTPTASKKPVVAPTKRPTSQG